MSSVNRQWRWYSPRSEGQPVTKKDFMALQEEGRAALVAAMKDFKKGKTNLSDHRHLEGKLYEMRVQVGTNPFRLIFSQVSPVHYVVLHVFYKNQVKTPKRDLNKARKRLIRWDDTR